MTNYLRDNDGKFIPATQRPDGTWRKARRVKEGYVPQEEVPLYESKGKQFAARKSDLPVGMCPIVAQAAKEKREKQQQKRSKTNPAPGVIVLPNNQDSNSSDIAKAPIRGGDKQTKTPNPPKELVNDEPEVESLANEVDNLNLDSERQEQIKKLRKLKKKLREIETIEARINSGELKKPEKDQLDKVKRKGEVVKEIQDLENVK